MWSRLPASLFVLALSVRLGFAESSQFESAKADAVRLSASWQLGPYRIVEKDGRFAEATDARVVILGRGLGNQLNLSSGTIAKQRALTFIVLHELWHVKQIDLLGSDAFMNAKQKPALECQADLAASYTLILDALQTIKDFSDPTELAAASRRIEEFRSTWGALSELLPSGDDPLGHLDRRERILALQFGFWRAYSDRLSGAPKRKLRELAEHLAVRADAQSASSFEQWSRGICDRIVGYDKSALSSITFGFGAVKFSDNGTDVAVEITAANNSYRDISVSASVLLGYFAAGMRDNFAKYTFMDAASDQALIKPNQTISLHFKMRVPQVPKGSEMFMWTLPFLQQALLSARYSSPDRPPPNCNAAWTPDVNPLLADLARLGGMAQDRFKDAYESADRPLSGIPIYKSSVVVRGSLGVEIFTMGEPTAEVLLYKGTDEAEALGRFRASADMIKKSCRLVGAISEWVGKDGEPNLLVHRLTANSQALLTISARQTQNGRQFEVSWRVSYPSF